MQIAAPDKQAHSNIQPLPQQPATIPQHRRNKTYPTNPTGRFTPANLPDVQTLITTPRLTTPLTSIPSISAPPPQHAQSFASNTTHPETSSSSSPSCEFPAPAPSAAQIALEKLANRLPATLNPDTPTPTLPESTNHPAAYAPLLDLDHIPATNSVPTLPLTTPNLETKLATDLTSMTDETINTRADILYTLHAPPPHPHLVNLIPLAYPQPLGPNITTSGLHPKPWHPDTDWPDLLTLEPPPSPAPADMPPAESDHPPDSDP